MPEASISAMTNPESFIQNGHWWVNPSKSLVYLDFGIWQKYLNTSDLERILKWIEKPLKLYGEQEIEIKGDQIHFAYHIWQCTPNPQFVELDVPISEFKEICAKLYCPHFLEGDKPKFKSCEYCVYFFGSGSHEYYCKFTYDQLKPIIRICNEGRAKYIKTWANHWGGYGEIHAELHFKVNNPKEWYPEKWNRLHYDLHQDHDLKLEGDLLVFRKYWGISDHVKYTITLNPADHTGVIHASEGSEISCRDDWYQIKFMDYDKATDCLFAFARVCWAIGGKENGVEPILLPPKPEKGAKS